MLKFKLFAIAALMGGTSLSTFAAVGVDNSFQRDIDTAFKEIMMTVTGQAVCRKILGSQADAIQFHLGVSADAAKTIAKNCGNSDNEWVFATAYSDLHSSSAKNLNPRQYVLLSAANQFPIESWTDPQTNTTALLAGPEGISHERLVQLLAHEMAVYFDSKANPSHPDALNIPVMKDLRANVKGDFDPLVAMTDPMVAITLTYVRALQVEYSIVDELIDKGIIQPPADHDQPALLNLISPSCQQDCLQKFVNSMRPQYLPIGLPLIAFAPYFRTIVGPELQRSVHWGLAQWAAANNALTDFPVDFLRTQFTGDPVADMQRVFVTDAAAQPAFKAVCEFLDQQLWPLEEPAILNTRLPDGTPLLEFMKIPLLSSYNISLSNGPRVRVGSGNTE